MAGVGGWVGVSAERRGWGGAGPGVWLVPLPRQCMAVRVEGMWVPVKREGQWEA